MMSSISKIHYKMILYIIIVTLYSFEMNIFVIRNCKMQRTIPNPPQWQKQLFGVVSVNNGTTYVRLIKSIHFQSSKHV